MARTDLTQPRYVATRALGRGGMGAVWLVNDAQRGQPVAMKRILGVHGEALRRFKREFRVVEQLLHPNIVRLHELGEDEQGLFFTMEPIDGADLLAWCRGIGTAAQSDEPRAAASRVQPVDAGAATVESDSGPLLADAESHTRPSGGTRGELRLDRLAHALPQILEALAFLHAQGLVHRDLKPGNVLVRRDGLVKVLDFGILAELSTQSSSAQGEIVGTVGYMAPEQIRGATPGPASDLYSLGCMLFEIVAGVTPFRGPPVQVLAQQLSAEAPRLDEVAPGSPPPLVEACEALLRREPGDRPTLEALAASLLPAIGARAPVLSPPRPPAVDLVGRAAEQAALDERLGGTVRGEFGAVVLRGPTGVGKTALAAWLANEAERRGMTVLRGRGRPSERVAFNAVDGAIDELSGELGRRRRRTEPEDVRRARLVAAGAFPVLTMRREEPVVGRPGAGRRGVFEALVHLLVHVASQSSGLVLWIDDLQWADDDSIALLDHLVGAAPPQVLIVATVRDDVGESAASRWLADRGDVEILPVEALGLDSVCELVVRATSAAGAGRTRSDDAVRRLAESCDGRPILAELAGRALAREGADASAAGWLASTVAATSPSMRALLALLLAADGWLRVAELAELVARPAGEVHDELVLLERDALVRRAGAAGESGSVDLYHDAVRAAVADALADDDLRAAHARIADRLAGAPDAPAHRRVRHLIGAGREAEAAELAPVAAREAEALRAYGLAADMYRAALSHAGEDEIPMRRALADALERGARYVEAAAEWRRVGEADVEGRVDATLREAHALLAANEVSEGRRRLDEGLRASGEPPSGRGGLAGLWAGLSFMRGPPADPPAAERPDPEVVARAERDVRIGTMVAYFDPLSGIRFLHRARSTFAREGAAIQVAKSDWVFTYLALFSERRRGEVPLAARWMASARSWAERTPELDALARTYPPFLDGVAAQRDGRWDDAAHSLDQALGHLEREGLAGTFEHMLALVHRTQIDLFGQRMQHADASVARLVGAARDTDDSAIRCHVEIARAWLAQLRGDFEAAAAITGPLAERWSVAEPTFQRILAELERAHPTVWLGGAAGARERLRIAFREARRFRPLSTMYGGALAARWAIIEAAALRSGDRGASVRRIRRLFRIAEAAPPLATIAAFRALAYAEDARGRPEHAIELLRRARAHAERFDQRVDAAVCDHQLGLRLGGDEGRALRERAAETATRLGIHERVLAEDPALR